MRNLVAFNLQKLILFLSYAVFKTFHRRRAHDNYWIVGPHEIAGMVKMISKAINQSYSVVLNDHKYYDDDYHYYYGYFRNFFGGKLISFLVSPIIFAKLITKHVGFIYVGATGFLISSIDSREFEFRFLRRANKPIISYFVGSDILF